MYRIIIKISLKVPVSNRGNAHRIEFLKNSVFGNEWPTEPLSRIASQGLLFKQLYGELEAALQHSKEKIGAIRDSMGPRMNQTDQDESKIAEMLYGGRGKYEFRYKGRSKRVNLERKDRGDNLLSTMGCFNCGDPSRMC